jgi:hypothetical protein
MAERTAGTWVTMAAVACGACAAVAPALAGQEVRGKVVDAESAEPVVLAYVGLLAPGRELVVASLAGSDGSFSVRAPAPGSYFLYVTRTGYRAVLDGLFELGEDGLIEVAIGMTLAPVVLGPVVVGVEGRARDLRTVGYYERRDRGLGHFIEREEIQRTAIDDLTDAMRGIPSLVVETPAPSLLIPVGVLNPRVLVRSGTGTCTPALYVDGVVVAFGSRSRLDAGMTVRPDDFVDPSDVEAVEIYTSPAETPPEYESTGGCGVLLIWTRKR